MISVGALLGAFVTPATRGLGQTDAAAAASIVHFPLVLSDSARGRATVLELSNSSVSPVDVTCVLQDATRTCSNLPSSLCFADSDCPGGTCQPPQWSTGSFHLRMTPRQPLAWNASSGLAALPLEPPLSGPGMHFNEGSIQSVPGDPFAGSLLCYTTNDGHEPANFNFLRGTATLLRYEDDIEETFDVAKYNAIGIPGADVNNGDFQLILGGIDQEYHACPSSLALSHYAEHAADPSFRDESIRTRLALVPCTFDPLNGVPGRVVAKIHVVNEFEQTYSFTTTIDTHAAGYLSSFDTVFPNSSIFDIGYLGSQVGQTTILPISGGGLLGIAVEEHILDAERTRSAAFQLSGRGLRTTPDYIGPTPESCGDGLVSASEECDDGNLDDGDCCSSNCAISDHIECDDLDACTTDDVCQQGVCVGSRSPCDQCQTCHPEIGCLGDPCSVRIDLEPSIGRPGGRACLQATLTANGAQVGLARTFVAPPSGLSFGPCTINPQIGAGTPTNKGLSFVSGGAAGSTGIQISGGSTSIPDGPLFACQYSVAEKAPIGSFAFKNLPFATNPGFQTLPNVGGTDGLVVITECAADCDGRLGVDVGEVMKCINIFLGRPLCHPSDPGLSCPAADTNGNGRVSLSEVQRCVTQFLNGC